MAKNKNVEEAAERNIDAEINEAVEQIEKDKTPVKPKDNPMEKVILEIPISNEMQDDWICIINGHSYQVQRGEKVLVPRCVKEIYDNEQRQLKESFRRSQALQKAAEDKEKQLAFS